IEIEDREPRGERLIKSPAARRPRRVVEGTTSEIVMHLACLVNYTDPVKGKSKSQKAIVKSAFGRAGCAWEISMSIRIVSILLFVLRGSIWGRGGILRLWQS